MFNFIKLYVCDNCGKFNPKVMDGKQSYTACCVIKDKPYMSAGKRWSEAQRYIGLVFMIGGFIYAIIYDYYWYENFRKVIKFKKTLEEKLRN